ncbi:hypothetical protein HMPREF9591_02528 [Cutibacterium acnes HL086PA1]|nr:hypothetical protein HMPREF9591_02528 [Cutibacterium acnes HL086PA1]
MRRRPAWLGGPGKDADGAVLLTGPEAGELLKAAVGHAGGGLVDWHLDHVDANPGQSTTATYQARVQWPAGGARRTLRHECSSEWPGSD